MRGVAVLSIKKQVFFVFLCSFILLFKNEVSANQDHKIEDKDVKFTLTENIDGLTVEAQDLYFGTHELTKNDISVEAENELVVRVSDNRGSREGWSLKLKFDQFKDKNKNINGAQLFFPKVTPITDTEGEAPNNPPVLKGSDSAFVGSDIGKIFTVNGSNNLLASASAGAGFGEWDFKYDGGKKVQLHIPKNQTDGSYIAKLVYSFESAP